MLRNPNPSQPPNDAVAAFFFEHGGYSYDLKSETPTEGRKRCAAGLASAERYAESQGFTFEWSEDWSGDHSYREEGEAEIGSCESCVCRDGEGNVLASLGCIDDADANYRRVIEAELASEGMAEYMRRGAEVNS